MSESTPSGSATRPVLNDTAVDELRSLINEMESITNERITYEESTGKDIANEGTTNKGASSSGTAQHPTPSPPTMAPVPARFITLDVGGREFKTMFSTLTSESGYFRAVFSAQWVITPIKKEPYFIDADPDLFEHLLSYMRRPAIFPLFWTKTNGFNYALYRRLGHEAKFFQIDKLSKWIENQDYECEIMVTVNPPKEQRLDQARLNVLLGSEELDQRVFTKRRRTYICPRDIAVHKGRPDMCGQACQKAQAGKPMEYEEVDEAWIVETKRQYALENEDLDVTGEETTEEGMK